MCTAAKVRRMCLALLAFALLGAANLYATVTEIKNADLPLTISAPGSFIVVEFLKVNGWGVNGITIKANNVQIDLNGCALVGPGQQIGQKGSGICATAGLSGIIVKNGFVRKWRKTGVDLTNASNCKVENVISLENGEDGIRVGHNSLINNCEASSNVADGIEAGIGSDVIGCTACLNMIGFFVLPYGKIQCCTAYHNNDVGFLCATGVGIYNNVSSQNPNCGIEVMGRCFAMENVCSDNGAGTGGGAEAGGPPGAGIYVTGDCNRIDSNECSKNSQGIVLTQFNDPQQQDPTDSNLIVRNHACRNPNGDFVIPGPAAPVNQIGPIVAQPAGAGAWDNFSIVVPGP